MLASTASDTPTAVVPRTLCEPPIASRSPGRSNTAVQRAWTPPDDRRRPEDTHRRPRGRPGAGPGRGAHPPGGAGRACGLQGCSDATRHVVHSQYLAGGRDAPRRGPSDAFGVRPERKAEAVALGRVIGADAAGDQLEIDPDGAVVPWPSGDRPELSLPRAAWTQSRTWPTPRATATSPASRTSQATVIRASPERDGENAKPEPVRSAVTVSDAFHDWLIDTYSGRGPRPRRLARGRRGRDGFDASASPTHRER